MMNRQLVRIFSVLVGGLALLGLFTSGHLFDLMNVDIALDVLRVVLAGVLAYVGFKAVSDRVVNNTLIAFGLLYIGMGLVGLADSTVFELLPAGLTEFDMAFHLVSGLFALGVGLRSNFADEVGTASTTRS